MQDEDIYFSANAAGRFRSRNHPHKFPALLGPVFFVIEFIELSRRWVRQIHIPWCLPVNPWQKTFSGNFFCRAHFKDASYRFCNSLRRILREQLKPNDVPEPVLQPFMTNIHYALMIKCHVQPHTHFMH